MDTCPKCHYRRRPADAELNPELCPACGIAYHKWLARQEKADEPAPDDVTAEPVISLRERLLFVSHDTDSAVFHGRLLVWLAFGLWGGHFIWGGLSWEAIGSSFMHNVNLPFHEFGHVFFRPFGRFMTILGGSLFQVLMPLGLMLVFIRQRDNFAASITLWWSGQNFIDLSPYIDDAPFRSLPLVGGRGEDSHDWGNLLTMTHWLDHAHTLARSSFNLGTMIILLSLLWGFWLLRLQKRRLATLP